MSSRFSPETGPASTPAICIPQLIDPPPDYIDDWPIGLDAYGNWDDVYGGYVICETFRITQDGALPGWSGASADVGPNMQIDVKKLVTPNLYECNLRVRQDLVVKKAHGWYWVYIPPPPPFETPLLRWWDPASHTLVEMQALG